MSSLDKEKDRVIRCVTHYYGCDCHEYRYNQMREALFRIMVWADNDAMSGETREKAMGDISKTCLEVLINTKDRLQYAQNILNHIPRSILKLAHEISVNKKVD